MIMSATRKNYQTISIEAGQQEKEVVKDISLLVGKDEFSDTLAIGLTEKLFEGYNLATKGVALMVAKKIRELHKVYGDNAIEKIIDSLYVTVGGIKYSVGINSLLQNLDKEIKAMDYDLIILDVMEGKQLDNLSVLNDNKEKVFNLLKVKAKELELDEEKNFIELERIKLFVQNYLS